jgi:hypothetical protein
VTVFATLTAALLATERMQPERRRWAWMLTAGLFCATVNHKTVVLVLAVLALAALDVLIRTVKEKRFAPLAHLDRSALALAAGFGIGTLLWWAYAWIVHAESFIQDHLRKHIAHRILLNDFRLGPSPDRYAPGMLEVWIEFAVHTGYLFVPVVLVGVLVLFAVRSDAGRLDLSGQGAGLKFASTLGPVLAAWFLTGAVLYTVTDWRQTKHLMNQLAPMVAAAVVFVWPVFDSWRLRRRIGFQADRDMAPLRSTGTLLLTLRVLAAAAVTIALLFNVWLDVRLTQDFGSLTISGASDIDGW